jgi:hypothetical protein
VPGWIIAPYVITAYMSVPGVIAVYVGVLTCHFVACYNPETKITAVEGRRE